MNKFKLKSNFTPQGGQSQAIDKLTKGINNNYQLQTLLGVTGSGKTYTMANVIENIQKSTLVIAHNKTLAAQLYLEFRNFFPDNAVRYFVSYYDYYQPEAYLPSRDMYIAKDAQVNEELDKLRHGATSAILTRNDVIVVASVSCIYNIGSPEEYQKQIFHVKKNEIIKRDQILKKLVDLHYIRNDFDLKRSTFRVRGDVIEIMPSYEDDIAIRIELFGDEVDKISYINPTTGKSKEELKEITIFSATHFITTEDKIKRGLKSIKKELDERIKYFESKEKLVEAQRIEQKTNYDIEMIENLGYCSGIENYSRHFSDKSPGEPPDCLIDYFKDDFLIIIDESHMTIPQIKGMYRGDRARKENLVKYGFRLPSAYDNRPLKFSEFKKYMKNVVFTSATPAEYELNNSNQIVELINRPTGLVDPKVYVRPTKGQIDDLISEIQKVVDKKERVLITTLTKHMAEDLTNYLLETDIKARYLHSEIDTIERTEIIRDLRLGKFDVLVGINLLREGLDLPEVSLVAILDADKEGFLRSDRALIQTMGRVARNISGKVIMYADNMTNSMKAAIDENERRREIQLEFNKKHNIVPKSIKTKIHGIPTQKSEDEEVIYDDETDIRFLESEMKKAVAELNFEKAARLRDKLFEIKSE